MWSILLLLGIVVATIGFGVAIHHKTPNGEPILAGILTLFVGLAVCAVSICNIPPDLPALHNKAECVACSADLQQQVRPGYDWMEAQRQLDQVSQ